MKLWIDDARPAPSADYIWIKSTDAAIICLATNIDSTKELRIEEINLDHDAGSYANMGGDYINILKWLEKQHIMEGVMVYSVFKFHSMNPVGARNMRRICLANGWRTY